jgi:fructokinase
MIVVAGEALMDLFVAGATATGVAIDARVGGSPFNVAVGLARLGQPVAFLAGIGRGVLGERLLQTLADEGVNLDCVQRVAAPTTLGLVALDAAGVPDYAFYGDGAADRLLSVDALDALPGGTQAIHLGSFAAVVEPVASTLQALVEREHGRRVIAYEPNVRLNVEPDRARWRARIDWMLPRTRLLKVSAEDIELLHPGRALDDVVAGFRAAGASLVVVTRGGDGALGFAACGRVAVPPLVVEVVDTVGAGDTFQAALLTWLAEHGRLSADGIERLDAKALGAALHFAARAAAITCSRRGADLPRRGELN